MVIWYFKETYNAFTFKRRIFALSTMLVVKVRVVKEYIL